MKILVLVGSHRHNGNTDQLTRLMVEHLEAEAQKHQAALEVETIYLGQQNLQFCRGCRICYDRGEERCPLKDGILEIKAKMLAADGIVLASPVYVDDVSGIMKNFIDRLCHLCHRPQFAGKVACLVATTGSSPTSRTLGTMKLAVRTWGYKVVGQAGFKMGALMKPEETRARFDTRAERVAKTLFQAVYRQSAFNPSFYSLMVFKIQQKVWRNTAETGTLDYGYWQRQGWLDSQRTFYIPHQASPWKVALARLTGAIIGKFVV